jgi:hypothetical protein
MATRYPLVISGTQIQELQTGDTILGSIANITGGGAGQMPYQTAANTTGFTAAGSAGQYLQSTGTGAPTWATINALPTQTSNSGKYLTTDGTSASWGTVSSGDVVLVKTASFSGVANTSTTFDGVFTSTYKSYRVVVRQFYGNSPSANPVLNLRSSGSTNVQGNYNVMVTKVVGASNSSSVLGQNSQSYWDLPTPWTALSAQSSYYMDWTGVGFSNYEVLVSMSGLGNGSNTWWSGGYRWEGAATTFDGFIISAASGTNITGTVDIYGYK